MKYKPGDLVYIVENNCNIREAKIVNCRGGFCIIKFTDRDSGTRVRENRLYSSFEEAQSKIFYKTERKRNQYDYMQYYK